VKSLFEPSSVSEIEKRIERLAPESERQWGRMNVAQMLGALLRVDGDRRGTESPGEESSRARGGSVREGIDLG